MTEVFYKLFKLVLKKAWVLFVILTVLVIGTWINNEKEHILANAADIALTENLLGSLKEDLKATNQAISEKKGQCKGFLNAKSIARKARKKANDAKQKYEGLSGGWWNDLLNEHYPKRQLDRAKLKVEYESLEVVAIRADEARDRLASKNNELKLLEQEKGQLAAEIFQLKEWIDRYGKDPWARLVNAIKKQLPVAVGMLLCLVFMPLFIKVAFYYWLAPFAERLPPIVIDSNKTPPKIPEPESSSVSVKFDLAEDDEILVHPDFLQSSGGLSKKQTQWFLNPKIPISSILSGMCTLTRIQPIEKKSTRVVVSSQNHALYEIGVIEIPKGASMVLRPKALAGVIKKQDVPVHITKHWHIFNLHSWLTLQLRYLAFHGPCKLIIKGCRGVCSEEPDSNNLRLINQASTIGFSANLKYTGSRCETFVSYVRGKEGLFNDCFSGENGRFVYEEMAGGKSNEGVTGKGMEGLVDATLKVFGV